ncbi:unnamed protein product, partial [Brenthis ino]
MNRALFILLALCTLTAALVPRHRRAINTEDENGATSSKPIEICAPRTPCGWSIYRPGVKLIEVNITNTYCVCGVGQICRITVDDENTSAFVHHCTAKNGDTIETPES